MFVSSRSRKFVSEFLTERIANNRLKIFYKQFLEWEKERKSKCCLKMEGKMTTITNLLEDGSSRNFSFDFSYWSHDGFEEDDTGYLNPVGGSHYARIGSKILLQTYLTRTLAERPLGSVLHLFLSRSLPTN